MSATPDEIRRDLLDRIERQLDPDSLTAVERGRVNACLIAKAIDPDCSPEEQAQFAHWIVTGRVETPGPSVSPTPEGPGPEQWEMR